MKKIVTKDSLLAMLNAGREKQIRVIGRALVVLLDRQVADEKNSNTTKYDNGIGFTPGDAFHGSVTAKYFVKHKTLADWMVDRWMKPCSNGTPRIAKYSRQLNEAANAKLRS
jgi:hypothetical protein